MGDIIGMAEDAIEADQVAERLAGQLRRRSNSRDRVTMPPEIEEDAEALCARASRIATSLTERIGSGSPVVTVDGIAYTLEERGYQDYGYFRYSRPDQNRVTLCADGKGLTEGSGQYKFHARSPIDGATFLLDSPSTDAVRSFVRHHARVIDGFIEAFAGMRDRKGRNGAIRLRAAMGTSDRPVPDLVGPQLTMDQIKDLARGGSLTVENRLDLLGAVAAVAQADAVYVTAALTEFAGLMAAGKAEDQITVKPFTVNIDESGVRLRMGKLALLGEPGRFERKASGREVHEALEEMAELVPELSGVAARLERGRARLDGAAADAVARSLG